MIARGRVQGGVVVLENPGDLREGAEVAVVALGAIVSGVPAATGRHGVLDIPTIHTGGIKQALSLDDDLLGEMLDDAP